MNNLTNILDQKSALVNKLKDVDLQNKKGKQEVATVKIENVSGRNLILTKMTVRILGELCQPLMRHHKKP